MTRSRRNDIRIGEDKWITFIELESNKENVIELDGFLKPVEQFINTLELECVAECCGISAYQLFAEDIKISAAKFDQKELLHALADIRKQVADIQHNNFVSFRMNNYFHKSTLLDLIDHIFQSIET